MDLLKLTKQFCQQHQIIPARSKGQNFLIEEDVYDQIIMAADLSKEDTVLEVGPGLGFLTQKLAAKAGRVIAVELDDKLAELLNESCNKLSLDNVIVLNQNILDFNFQFPISNFQINSKSQIRNKNAKEKLCVTSYKLQDYKIVANLPYNITSRFLRYVLTQEIRPRSMVLMLQKEVAERIVAKPPKMSLLSVSIQFYAEPQIIGYVPSQSFWPTPEVDSAIVRITTHPNPPHSTSSVRALSGREQAIPPTLLRQSQDRHFDKGVVNPCFALPLAKGKIKRGCVDKESDFFRLVKFGFVAKRKMLKNNLAAGYKISQENAENYLKLANLPQKARAENLSIDDWIRLLGVLGKNML